jgi:hypothetical protein
MKRIIVMDSLCSKIAPKIMIFLYGILIDGFGVERNGFSFVKNEIFNRFEMKYLMKY